MEDKQEAGANSQKFNPTSVNKRIKGFDLSNSVKEIAVVAFTSKQEMVEYQPDPDMPVSSKIQADINKSFNSQREMSNKTNEIGLKQHKEITDLHKAPEIKGVEDGAGTMVLELKLN